MENDKALNVQNGFFNQLRKDRTRITIFLSNGQRISGLVKSFDRFTVLLDSRHGEQMIFKHAIATISVSRPSDPAGGAERAEKPERTDKFGNYIDFEGKKET